MATHLQQLLRSLCWKTEWDYAVFWKLKHHDRMVLTWEDGYYNNQNKHDLSECKSFNESLDALQDGHFAHNTLGLAVSKMSYNVYSLGEGIIGQVAVTGNHQWIFAGEHAMNSYSSLELYDDWQAQFTAGIKTILVASVVPHGVIQFGSLNKVNENLQFLAHIRDAFNSLQESACQIQPPAACSLQHTLQTPDMSSTVSSPDALQDYLLNQAVNMEHISDAPASVSRVHFNEAVGLFSKDGLPEAIKNASIVQTVTEIKQSTDLLNNPNYSSYSSTIRHEGANDTKQVYYPSQSCITENSIIYDGKITDEQYRDEFDYSHPFEEKISELLASDSIALQKAESTMEILPEFNCTEISGDLNPSFMFSAGTELHEALGPAFLKQCYSFPSEVEKREDSFASQIPEVVESSMITSNSCNDHLLEDVVANFCRRDTFKKSKSFSTSDSMLTTERMPQPSINTSHTICSSYYSVGRSSLVEESMQNCLKSSDSYSIRSSTSACGEKLVMSVEPGKPNKKRARPGENSRPRPRDRQLIQDRIKELRELVPNGSKCSIDSLLERTIKHMGFMQNVTKHSEKLTDCAKSKGGTEIGPIGSAYEQGSSWAVEVGGHMKICPILVKNLNMNGQMLVEMLCDDCDHFLEITETIRSLGLTILKGITDSHGDKTWMRFVVEAQSNRNLHRMDVLWSLVQTLQSKTAA